MDRIIRDTVTRLINTLSQNRTFYTPEYLAQAGFPVFLVQRMRLEMQKHLRESLTVPETEWSDTNTSQARMAWGRFLEAVSTDLRVPSGKTAAVIEAALSDILELLVSPRSFLADYLFETRQELTLEELRERCQWVVVYPFFATALPRFMEKKQKTVLSKDQAVLIVERLDERVTSRYGATEWVALFEPWFELLGEQIDPSLLARFFRDKGKPGMARLFEAMQEPIGRQELSAMLHRPQFDLEFEDGLTGSADTGGWEPESDANMPKADHAASHKDAESVQDRSATPVTPPPQSSTTGAQPGPIDRAESDERGATESEIEDTDDAKSSHQSTPPARTERSGEFDTPHPSTQEQKTQKEKELNSGTASDTTQQEENLLSRFLKHDRDEDEAPLYERLRGNVRGEQSDDERPLYSRIVPSRADDEDEVPIWQRFTAGADDQEPVDKHEDLRFSIRQHVRDMEQEFTDHIFGGDQEAFLEALDTISRFEEWRQAGAYINKEIFERNNIDLYSDTAIYFTDRMQTYFLDR